MRSTSWPVSSTGFHFPHIIGHYRDLADPVRPIPGYRGQLSGGAALCQQPQQLPPRTLVGLFSATVAALEFVDAQMWLEVDVSGHAAILLPPTTIPYEWPVVLRRPWRRELQSFQLARLMTDIDVQRHLEVLTADSYRAAVEWLNAHFRFVASQQIDWSSDSDVVFGQINQLSVQQVQTLQSRYGVQFQRRVYVIWAYGDFGIILPAQDVAAHIDDTDSASVVVVCHSANALEFSV